MPTEVVDPRWPEVLKLTGHEFRTPMTVIVGYLKMLLKEQAGPVNERQRSMLQEIEKSCTRLTGLLAEISQLSALEGGNATFHRHDFDLRDVLTQSIAALPAPDRDVKVELRTGTGAARVNGDAARLRTALTSVIHGIRREIVTSDRLLVQEQVRPFDGRNVSWIVIGDEAQVQLLSNADSSSLSTFNEGRGGCGLSLVIAHRIINAHDASIWSPKKDEAKEEGTKEEEAKVDKSKTGAVIAIPVS
jgi:K+-sensing histidine kinase KdpD